MQEKHFIKHFAPGWFAVVMGTGGLANILFGWGRDFPPLSHFGTALAGLADILYFLLLVPWLIRWVRHFEYVQRDLHHPVTTNLFVTMPVATVILGTNVHLIWSRYLSAETVFSLTLLSWVVAIAGVTIFTFFTSFRLISVELSPNPETMNFSWIMSPIANMAVLLIGNPVLSRALQQRPEWAMSIFVVNTALLGVGIFLFVFISSIIFVRLAHHPLPPAETTPSFGIFLSAVGLLASAIFDLSKNAKAMGLIGDTSSAAICALGVWGFGIWIIGIIALISRYQLRRGGIPFNLGWWAFVFPLAAYTICSQKIASYFVSPLTYGFSVVLTAFLSVLWLYIFVNTLKGVINGAFFTGKTITRTTLSSAD
jgi:C4-dicarboxylate transporter/malic acid transport protein